MKKNLKRALTTAVAGVMSVNCLALSSVLQAGAATAKYEFESGKLTGDAEVKTDDGNASGGSYVFLKTGGDEISLTVPSEKTGMYTVKVSYSAPYGDKIQNLYVNGVDQGQCSFASTAEGVWKELDLGTVKLTAGDNTIAIKGSWGWTNFDYLTVEEATLPDITASDTTCSDPAATKEADSLMKYLSSVYGKHIISGQQEIYKYGPHDFEYEFKYINDTTGKYPAIRGFDYLNCNPLYGSEDGTTDRIIQWVNNNPYSENQGIATSSWHITVPKDFSSYNIGDKVDWANATYVPKETDFEPSKILEEGTKEREYYMLCLKGLAAELQKLQDANVPLIFRPLHEAEGGGGETGSWFWWGKEGSAVYKELWILTYETLTEQYGLHNLIWEWNSYAYDTSANWYPGDEYVDIVAYDKYNCTDWSTGSAVLTHNDSAISSTFYSIMQKYNSKKMVAMSENDSIPTLNNLVSEKAGWLYFCPWYDGGSESTNFLTNELFNKKDDLKEMYTSDYCITLDELPTDLYGNGQQGTGTKPSHTTQPTTTTTVPEGKGEAAKIVADSGNYNISFKQSIGNSVNLTFDLSDDVSKANGCIGISANVDGVDYWLNYKWDLDSTDEVTAKLDKPYNITYNNGKDEVTDADMIKKISDEAIKQKNAQVQIWWVANGAGDTLETSNVKLTGAYLPKSSSTSTESSGTTTTISSEETTTEATTVSDTETTTVTEATTVSDAETTTATEATTVPDTETTVVTTESDTDVSSDTTAVSTDETTTTAASTTASDSGEVPVTGASLYGDVNLDGKVDITDAVLLNKKAAGQVDLNAQATANADCMFNGEINGDDATTLLQFLVQLIRSLPVNPQ